MLTHWFVRLDILIHLLFIGNKTMGKLSTHVLDTSIGKPGKDISIQLFRVSGAKSELLTTRLTNSDGRCDEPLLEGDQLKMGEYQLEFDIGAYFAKSNPSLPDPAFLNIVVIRFQVANVLENYHVPLVVTPWSYSTYRGS
jgi:5-hydroxyisourate hydrolase